MPAGRPTDYRDEYCEQVEKLCKLGATDAELADFFEVTETTVNNWKITHPEFFESIKKGKIIADANVAQRLYQRATGYEYSEVTFEKIDNKVNLEVTPDAMITTDAYRKKIVTKELAPDTTAAIFWLKNRQPAKWRDKTEQDISGNLGLTWHEEKTYEADQKANTGS